MPIRYDHPVVTAESKQNLVALRSRREEVIRLLSERFSDDVLELDEFERRVGLAHKATSLVALDELVDDLASTRGVEQPGEALAPAHSRQELEEIAANRPASKTFAAIMSGVERKGQWRVPRQIRLLAVMGGASLDFRDVHLPPGRTRIRIFALMGGVEIIVPPNLAVECDGIGIMGGFQSVDRAPPLPDPEQPLLEISGVAIMGGFEVMTRLPGESARDARRREKRERKDKRRKQLTSGRA
jgi:hypothetical protein